MKFLRAWVNGAVVPGVLDNNGVRRNISALAADVTSAQISGAGLAQIKGADLTALPEIAADAPLVAPWADCKKFICIGLNYADHAAESGLPIPPEPIIFTKSIDARVGPNHDVVLPQGSVKGDWEVELGVVIGQTARYVEQADALNYVAGYCVVNDVSEREYQIEPLCAYTHSMVVFGHKSAPLSNQKIKVRALIGLQNMVNIQTPIPA